MQLKKSSAEKRLADLFMDDLPVMEFNVRDVTVSPDWFTKYKTLRRDFMKSLTDSIEELAFLNLSQDEFMGLIMGREMPENLSLRFRVPLVWGGKLEIDNMFLCRTFPHSQNMDIFIIEQAGKEIIWLPNPAKKVYVPAHTAGGGDGGNATEDRLSQLAAQLATNRGME
ncbi:MAG: hypothetical protein JW974_02740 [Alphaproteobacteria bacterium]|nr:hypothetical protein [Alphaproteobacteria bacterium]MBN2675569.1 hypothetical protein [Alphaproteobacteria bacterium]